MQANTNVTPASAYVLPRTSAMCEKIAFLNALKTYIRHKKILSTYSGYYNNMAKMESLAKCEQLANAYCRDMYSASLYEIAKMVLIHDKNLRAILPAIHNLSYKSSEQNLENLLHSARTICNQKKSTQC